MDYYVAIEIMGQKYILLPDLWKLTVKEKQEGLYKKTF